MPPFLIDQRPPRVLKIPLRFVLIVPFVLQILIAVGLTGYLAFRHEQQSVKQLSADLRSEITARVIHYLDTYLSKFHLINRINSDDVRLGALNPKDLRTLERHLMMRLMQFNFVRGVLFADEQGNYRAAARLNKLQVLTTNSGNLSIAHDYAINARGNRTSLLTTYSLGDVQNFPWYRAAASAGTSTWSSVYALASGEDLSLNFNSPVYDPKTGQLAGVFSTATSLAFIGEFLSGLKIGKTGQVFILERDGLLLGTSTDQRLYTIRRRKGKVQLKRVAAIDSSSDLIRTTSEYLLTHFGEFQHIHHEKQLNFTAQGKRQFVQVVPYQDLFGLDWLIVVVVPESDFMQQINASMRTTIFLCISALSAAIAIGLLTSHWIAQPILRLSRASRALAIGKWEVPVKEAHWIAELEVLARSFNQMTEHLQQSFDQVKTALQQSEEKFTKVFRASPDPIAVTTMPEGRILEVNDSFLEISGYSREEMLGRTALELNLIANLEQAIQAQQRLQVQKTLRNLEFNYRTKSGQIRTLLVSAEVIELEGQVCGLWVSRDITDRHPVERDQQHSEANLK